MILLILSDLFQKQEKCQENEKVSCTSDIFVKNISGKGVIQNIQTTLKNQNKKTTSF